MVIGQCIHSNNHTAKLVQGFNIWIIHLYGIRANLSVRRCKCKSQTSHSMHTRLRGSSVGCVFFSNDAQTLHAIAAVTRASLLSNPAYASSAPSFFSNLQNKHYISYHTVRVTMLIYYSSACSPTATLRRKSVVVNSPAVKAPILGEACIRVRIKYFYSFMTFGPY